MDNVKVEIISFEREINELYKLIDESMQIDEKCVEEDNILDIIKINKEIINNLDKLI